MHSSPMTSPRFRSPQLQGFQELPNSSHSQSTYGANTMDPDADIPLAPMRSNVSFGARKSNQGGVGPEIYRLRSAQGADNANNNATSEKNANLLQPHGRPIGRRRVNREPEAIHRQGSFDTDVALNFMGRLYKGLMTSSPIVRYIVYVLPVAFLLAIPLVVLPVTGNAHTVPLGYITTNATTVPPTRIDGPPLFHLFVWIEASWAGLWVSKIVAHLIPVAFVFFCGVVSSGTRKYATVLGALEVPLSIFFWALITWLVFRGFFNDHRLSWIYALHNILGSLFVSSAVFLAERAVIQLMSISYHNRSFAGRIRESKREIHLLGLLYDASRALFPMYCSEFAEEDYIINDSIEAMLSRQARRHRFRSNPDGTTVTPGAPMRLIGNVGRFGDKVTSAFGNIASEITGKQMFNPNSAHSIVVEALEKVRSSEALARRIWMSFVIEDNDALYLDDIREVLGPLHKAEAEECFDTIDADANGDISLDEMIRKVVDIGKERHAMANSMKDISSALAAFDSVLLFLVLLVVIFIFLAFFQSSFITTLATAGTALLSLSFVFSVTAQEVLGSCIFLFVKHPFDVGDRVDIGTEQLVVEKISLLYTVFTRIDRMQTVQIPNIVLNSLWVENVSRSNAMREVLDVNVSFDTSFEDIELLRLEMEKFVRHPDNSRDFQRDLSISVSGVGDLDKLQLQIAIKHKSNWHNDLVRATRRSKFLCALALALKKVPIYAPGGGGDPAGAPANPTYSVTVSDAEAAAARAEAAREKNMKRMVPVPEPEPESDPKDEAASTASAEKRAVRELNAVDPLADIVDDNDDKNHDMLSGMRSHTTSSKDQAGLSATTSSAMRNRSGTAVSHSSELNVPLHGTVSQRGRRQAGQGLPPMPVGENALARYASSASRRTEVSMDLERGGGGSGVAFGNYDSNASGQSRNMPPPPPSRQ